MSLKLSGMVSGMDTESMVTELMKAQSLKKTKLNNKITTTEWKQDKWKTLNSKIYSFYTGQLSKLKMQGTFNTKKVTTTDDSKVSIAANTTAADGTHTLLIKQLAKAQSATGDKLATTVTGSTKLVDLGMTENNTISVKIGTDTKTISIKSDTTVDGLVQKLKDAGINANYDSTQKRFFISAKKSGTDNAFELSATSNNDLAKIGLNAMSVAGGVVSTSGTTTMSVIQPVNSKVVYNGTEIISSSNVVTANGLTMTLKAVSEGVLSTPDNDADDVAINLNVTKDTQAAYDTVKSFIKSYNELLDELNTVYNATSAKGYDPLTDEQKESMTDTQIEKWETKIKDALLRRDSNLGSIINTMRSDLSETVTVNGKKYSLSSFGISSTNYTEKGHLHINGDSEDSLTSAYENDLMKALTDDPDTVMKVMNGLADKLYTSLNKSMTGSTLRSTLTIYNDKELAKSVTSYKADLKTLETKLSALETRYYKQFSAMESAMSKMNSQSSSLSSMLSNQ